LPWWQGIRRVEPAGVVSNEACTHYLVGERSECKSQAINLPAVVVFGASVTIRLGQGSRPPIGVLQANSINVVAPVEKSSAGVRLPHNGFTMGAPETMVCRESRSAKLPVCSSPLHLNATLATLAQILENLKNPTIKM
jgi:hypothetical protein